MAESAKILIVDDDPDFLVTTRSMLNSSSYRVGVVAGEQDALLEIEAEIPDLLILDVMMSKCGSGFELMWKLRNDPRYKAMPILVVTGLDKEGCMSFARDTNPAGPGPADEDGLPVDGYLLKPVRTTELLEAVGRILRQRGTQVPS
ncbi:MAG: response regulator [Phycisphaerae bacterium]|nr:response regulator [Phycisphaerae bacterium]